MPPNPHPDSIPAPMWDIIYVAEQRVKYIVAPNSAVAGEEVHFNNIFYLYTFYKFLIIINQGDNVEAFDQYDDPDFHRCSDAQPFRGLCASLKNSYGGRGNYVYYYHYHYYNYYFYYYHMVFVMFFCKLN